MRRTLYGWEEAIGLDEPVALSAAWVRSLRQAAELSQQSLADELGCTQPEVARWEAGQYTPMFETVLRLLNIQFLTIAEQKAAIPETLIGTLLCSGFLEPDEVKAIGFAILRYAEEMQEEQSGSAEGGGYPVPAGAAD